MSTEAEYWKSIDIVPNNDEDLPSGVIAIWVGAGPGDAAVADLRVTLVNDIEGESRLLKLVRVGGEPLKMAVKRVWQQDTTASAIVGFM